MEYIEGKNCKSKKYIKDGCNLKLGNFLSDFIYPNHR